MGHGKIHGFGDTNDHAPSTYAEINALMSDADIVKSGGGTQAVVINVADGGLKASLDAITDSSIAKPYIVNVDAGVYSIGDNVLNIPAYVTLQGCGDVILDFTGNTTQEAITMVSGAKLRGIAVQNHLSSAYAINIDTAGSYVIDDITFINVTNGIQVNHASARVTVRQPTFLPFSAPMTSGIKSLVCESFVIYNVRTGGAQAITDLVWATGSGSHVHLFGMFSEETGVVNALRASSSARLEANEFIVKLATKGALIESGATMTIRAGILNENDYGVDISGSGSLLDAYNISMLANTVLNFQAGAGTTARGFGISDPDKFSVDPDAKLQASFLSTVPGDESLTTIAELHVGLPGFPRESAFGEGDSYVNGMKIYTYDAGLDSYTDETAAAKSPTGSTFTMGLDVNDALYCGSIVPISASEYHQFFGIKFLSTVAAVLGSGDMVAEYPTAQTGSITAFADAGGGQVTVTSAAHGLSNGDVVTISGTTNYNGTFEITNVTTNTFEITDTWVANDATGTWGDVWSRFNTMTCQSSGQYYRQNSDLFTAVAGNYQVMFDPRITSDWTKVDPPTLGTNYYWVRFRIRVATITTAPTFQQIKLHSNRAEINADGYRELFGKARAYYGIPVSWNTFQDAGGNMTDQDLWLTTNSRAGMVNNVFNGDGRSVGALFPLPRWVDTSAPLVIEAIIVPAATVSGSLTMTAYLNSSTDGDAIATGDPTVTTGEVSQAITKTVTALQQETFTFELDISDKGKEGAGVPAELLWLNLEATSRPGAGNIFGMSFLVKALQFRDGEHVTQ